MLRMRSLISVSNEDQNKLIFNPILAALFLSLSINVSVNGTTRAVLVGQLVKQLLPTPEVRGSIPVIGKIYVEQCFLSTLLKG